MRAVPSRVGQHTQHNTSEMSLLACFPLTKTDSGAYHHVHANELRPHLDRYAKHNSIEHPWFGQRSEGIERFLALKAEDFFYFSILGKNVRVTNVTLAVQICKYTY